MFTSMHVEVDFLVQDESNASRVCLAFKGNALYQKAVYTDKSSLGQMGDKQAHRIGWICDMRFSLTCLTRVALVRKSTSGKKMLAVSCLGHLPKSPLQAPRATVGLLKVDVSSQDLGYELTALISLI